MTPSSRWLRDVLARFDPQVLAAVPLTVVEDRDQVVASEQVATELGRRSADLVTYKDPVAFRYLIESRYRDNPGSPHLVVRTDDLQTIPWDIAQAAARHGRCFAVSLAELFPNLDPEVLSRLDRTHLDVLSHALLINTPVPGRHGTIDFILAHVFHIVPATIIDEAALLDALIGLHYAEKVLPVPVAERIISLLAARPSFVDWPLREIVLSSAALWRFLQAGWEAFLLDRIQLDGDVSPETVVHVLPFDDPRIRVRLDNLFLEGYLTPTRVIPPGSAAATSFGFGVASENRGSYELLEDLTARVLEIVPGSEADHNEWRRFARTWGEWTAAKSRVHSLAGTALATTVAELQTRVQSTFEIWMLDRYAGMISLPCLPTPPMLHHVADYVSHGRIVGQSVTRKAAVLVLDGMGFAQWHEIRPYLQELNANIEEHAVFAWVPTLTVVSRQAIFAGAPPYSFAQSIGTTRREPSHWRRYWTERGLADQSIRYVHAKKLGSGDAIVEDFCAEIDHPASRIIGGVIGTVDQMLHSSKIGAGGLRAQLVEWLDQGVLGRVVEAFLAADYDLYITSDHGNVEVRGNGRPNLGSIPEEQGERAGVFASEAGRNASTGSMAGAIEWPPHGLPPDYFPVLAPWFGAFIPDQFQIVSHGGVTVDEVIVPFLAVTRP